MSHSLKPGSLALWRAARDAEPNGVDRETAAGLVNKQGQDLSDHLFRMTQARYLTRIGMHGQGRWRIGNRVPKGEQLAPPPPPPPPPAAPPPAAPSPKAQPGSDDDDDTDVQDKREAVKGVPPGVPNSVFALGAMSQLGDAATLPAFAAFAPPPAASPAAVDLSSWRPAKPLVASAEAAPAAHDQAEQPPVQRHVRVVDEQPVSGTVTQVTEDVPRFSLGSDGTFAIEFNNPGRITRLNPEATRAMFAWLDRLGGLGLTDKLPSVEQAA